MKKFFVFLAAMMMTAGASAQNFDRPGGREEKFTLYMNGQFYKGHNQVVPLKRLLMERHPELRHKIQRGRVELVRVAVVAKSSLGLGMARLVVGGREQQRTRIPRTRGPFHDNSPWTYSQPLVLQNGNLFETQGIWQIRLHGDIKVDKIFIRVRYKGRHGGGHGPNDRRRGPGRDRGNDRGNDNDRNDHDRGNDRDGRHGQGRGPGRR